jgi:hypothetical protein
MARISTAIPVLPIAMELLAILLIIQPGYVVLAAPIALIVQLQPQIALPVHQATSLSVDLLASVLKIAHLALLNYLLLSVPVTTPNVKPVLEPLQLVPPVISIYIF